MTDRRLRTNQARAGACSALHAASGHLTDSRRENLTGIVSVASLDDAQNLNPADIRAAGEIAIEDPGTTSISAQNATDPDISEGAGEENLPGAVTIAIDPALQRATDT